MLVKTWSNGALFRSGTIDAGCLECADPLEPVPDEADTPEAPTDPSAIEAAAAATRKIQRLWMPMPTSLPSQRFEAELDQMRRAGRNGPSHIRSEVTGCCSDRPRRYGKRHDARYRVGG